MRILILTQNEHLYLPASLAVICREFRNDLCCVVSAPAMSTHGGAIKGFIRHLGLFGPVGTLVLGGRVIAAKIADRFEPARAEGRFFSVRGVASAFGVPYHAIAKVKSDAFEAILEKYRPELLVSISCPQIIGKKVRGRFPRGCINVHGAPLPRYRGLMPAFWALRFDEKKTAATVHDLADKLDNGAILKQRQVDIAADDTWDSLVRKTKRAGALALAETIREIKNGSEQRRPNADEEATYFSFPTAEDRKAFRGAGRRFF